MYQGIIIEAPNAAVAATAFAAVAATLTPQAAKGLWTYVSGDHNRSAECSSSSDSPSGSSSRQAAASATVISAS
jgi:hypothetical protein